MIGTQSRLCIGWWCVSYVQWWGSWHAKYVESWRESWWPAMRCVLVWKSSFQSSFWEVLSVGKRKRCKLQAASETQSSVIAPEKIAKKYHYEVCSNRGRVLGSDVPAISNDEEANVQNMWNHGARVDGSWVFGFCQGDYCRYFVVEQWEKVTFIPLIKRQCEFGSVIHSDEWLAYSSLAAEGFLHYTVNHQQNYIDPTSGAHTQAIERSWLDSKVSVLKKKRGVPLYQLQSHLDATAGKWNENWSRVW